MAIVEVRKFTAAEAMAASPGRAMSYYIVSWTIKALLVWAAWMICFG